MVKPTAQSGSAIEKLLQDRSQYEQWLARLASAGNAPDAVRERVRTDYEARLRTVMDELRTHGDTIRADLDRFRSAESELVKQESTAQERIAEAEIRHAVGEFEESKWQAIRDEAGKGLDEAREELTKIRAEIARLAEVQGLITAPAPTSAPQVPPPAAPAAAAPTAAPAPSPPRPAPAPAPAAPSPRVTATDHTAEFEPVIQEIETPAAAPQAPRFVPKAPGDELAFLKSVTEADTAETKARPSGPQTAPAAASEAGGKATAAQQAKTLKCGECGTMNRPTEWYCERCGAELAAL
jgi:hypothetical protein